MAETVYALFHNHDDAVEALRKIREDVEEERISLLVRETMPHNEQLDIKETDGKHGLREGALVGAITGAVAMTLLTGPFGLLGVGPLAAAVIGAGAGSAFGALGGGLSGLGLDDRNLEGWWPELENGRAIISVIAEDHDAAESVQNLLQETGAIQIRRGT